MSWQDTSGNFGGGSGGYGGGGGGGNRKRGRDFDDEGGQGGYGGGGGGGYRRQQRRFNDHDQPIAPYGGRDYSGMSGYGGEGGGRGRRGGGGFHGRGRGRRNYNHDDRDTSFQVLLSSGEKYSIDLWRFGDAALPDAKTDDVSRFTTTNAEDLKGLADQTRELWAKGARDDILRAFRIA